MKKKYVIITAFADVLFGLIPLYWKFLANVSTSYILAQRILWSIPFTLLIVALAGDLGKLRAVFHSPKVLGLTALAGVTITLNWYLYIWAVNSGMVMETSMAYFIAPLVVFLLGVFVFREKVSANEVAACCLAGTGIVIYAVWNGLMPWVALGLAVSFSIYGAFKKAAGQVPAVSLTVEMITVLPVAVVYLALTSFGASGALAGLPGYQLALLAGTGVISSFPLWLYSFGVKELPFSLVGFLQYIWPTTSLLLSIFAFHEQFTPSKLVCFLFIWAGLAVFSLPRLRGERHNGTGKPFLSSQGQEEGA